MSGYEKAVAVVSFNARNSSRKTFWQADLYMTALDWILDDWENCPAPDAFFTMREGAGVEACKRKAARLWPGCKIVDATDDDEDEPA